MFFHLNWKTEFIAMMISVEVILSIIKIISVSHVKSLVAAKGEKKNQNENNLWIPAIAYFPLQE